MIGYIYKTTNLINKKIYIGQTKSNKFKKNYFGSGIIIKESLKKYNKNNFTVEILSECFSKSEMNEKEIYYINLFKSNDLNIGYNLSSGGGGSFGYKLSEKTKQKISENHINVKGENNPFFGKTHTIETKMKLSVYHSGKTYSDDFKKKISDSMKGRIPWNLGINHSEESKKKMSQSHTGKKNSEFHNKKISESKKGKIHSEETKKKIGESRKLSWKKLKNNNDEQR